MKLEIHTNPGALAQMAGAAGPVKSAAPAEAEKILQGNDKGLTVSEGGEAAAVDAVPDSALDRNDPLGRLVNSVYSFLPPAFPQELA